VETDFQRGIDKPEPLPSDSQHAFGNRLIALDLIRAIETDTQPKAASSTAVRRWR